ncbi:HupE/UreJ family protein [Cronbergia sp. UHCC 0137]|uniref:HupE/UreJ family protein n=1 Tax=Cronbergia sp. UHCC 0137 TaxID=3110239 RepID=UPI002B1F0E67|nr:HupE/UreJ family protein [Cronbergia sp. UHCC 0137]MEA5620387.1 HupE/UreJ family protein [Cronbergia sp. UHCC 0137]
MIFKIGLSEAENRTSKQHRYLLAIAALVVISLLSSLAGTPVQHDISNCWEGLIWGIADPVLGLNRLAPIIAIGILSARFASRRGISVSFVLAALCGQLMYLSQVNLPGAEIAIAISTIVLGAVLVTSTPLDWRAIALLSIATGLFQGYAGGESIPNLEMLSLIAYIFGVTLTQSVIIISARQMGNMNQGDINQMLPKKIRFAGAGFCAIGIVFLGNAFI